MTILLTISLAALFALLWAAFSIAQHIRRTRRTTEPSEALLPELLVPQESAQSEPAQASYAMEVNVAQAETPQEDLVAGSSTVEAVSEAIPVQQELPPRFPPASVPQPSRVDWAYYKEEMGDLTDPLPAHARLRARSR